jgi:hypothetical protein
MLTGPLVVYLCSREQEVNLFSSIKDDLNVVFLLPEFVFTEQCR